MKAQLNSFWLIDWFDDIFPSLQSAKCFIISANDPIPWNFYAREGKIFHWFNGKPISEVTYVVDEKGDVSFSRPQKLNP